MLDLGRFCAWVTINDEETPEYCVEVLKEGESVACWIPSEAGKSFAVHWTDKTGQDDTCGSVSVDGVFAAAKQSSKVGPVKASAARVSVDKERPFIFSQTEYTDDDAYLDQVSSELGTITLTIDQVNIVDEAASYSASSRFAPYQTTRVHERSKKLNVHSVQFGTDRPAKATCTKGSLVRRVASFTFKYRPLEFLQVQEIAPRPEPPSVDNSANPRDIPDEDVKPEIVEISTKLQQLQAQMDALKERMDSINQVKREHVPVFLPGEVIDLT